MLTLDMGPLPVDMCQFNGWHKLGPDNMSGLRNQNKQTDSVGASNVFGVILPSLQGAPSPGTATLHTPTSRGPHTAVRTCGRGLCGAGAAVRSPTPVGSNVLRRHQTPRQALRRVDMCLLGTLVGCLPHALLSISPSGGPALCRTAALSIVLQYAI